MLKAITRGVSTSINDCELSFHTRIPIDVSKARAQHRGYEDCLRGLGVEVFSLPAEAGLPDAVFVEDPAVVVDEVAVVCRLGAASRRAEAGTLAATIGRFRPLQFLTEPATLEGGDVMRIARTLFVGASRRTNREGREQLQSKLGPYGYQIKTIEVRGCLHLKSACSYIGNNAVLANRNWINTGELAGLDLIDVPEQEPGAANALLIGRKVILPESFPRTRDKLSRLGFEVRTVDVSELQKAESGVSCMSLILNDERGVV